MHDVIKQISYLFIYMQLTKFFRQLNCCWNIGRRQKDCFSITGIEFKYFVDKLGDLFSQRVRRTQGCYINYLDVEILLLHQNFMCVGGKDITCTTTATIAVNILAYHTSWLPHFHKNHLIRLHDISSKVNFKILSINS